MTPRWNADVLRGLLLAYSLHSIWEGIGAFRLGIWPYQPMQFWIGLGVAAAFSVGTVAFLWTTRPRLQAAFVLFASLAAASLLWLLWICSARVHAGQPVSFPPSVYFGQAMNVAAAVGAWLLYRSEPKAA